MMLQLLIGLLLTFLTITPMHLSYRKSKDLLSPITFFNFFTFISIVPRLLIMDHNIYTQQLHDLTLIRFFLITALGLVSINFFFYLNEKKFENLYSINYNSYQLKQDYVGKQRTRYSIAFILLVFLIGVISKIYLLMISGGISYIWSNIYLRVSLLSGNNYVNSLEVLMILATALMFEKHINSKNSSYLLLLVIMAIITSFLLLSFGGRSSFVKLLLLFLFVYNYRRKLIVLQDFFKIKYILLFFSMALIVVMLPMVRFSGYSQIYLNPILWITEAAKNILKFFDAITPVDRDMMTYDLFSEREFWYGKSYIGLLYAWIPRSLYSNKPPVDDGVYLANLIQGFEVEPPMPYDDIIFHSSSPFSSFGIMYANFGMIGVIFSGYLLSKFYYLMYQRTVKRKSVANILIYGYLMIIFGLSVHSFLSFAVPSFIIWVLIGKKIFRFTIGNRNR